MRRWGCTGASIGAAVGLLGVVLLVLATRPAPPQPAGQPLDTIIAPDVTVFLSEQSLSRAAADRLGQPVLLDVDPHGQIRMTTRVPLGQIEALMEIALRLEMEGTELGSRLRWVRVGFLLIPARWLPQSVPEAAESVGQIITSQLPPEFRLIGFSTTADGVNFQLKWIGQ